MRILYFTISGLIISGLIYLVATGILESKLPKPMRIGIVLSIGILCVSGILSFLTRDRRVIPKESDTTTVVDVLKFDTIEKIGTQSDVAQYARLLEKFQHNDAFLTIGLNETDDFFQIKLYEDNTAEFDFPLVTERQNSLRYKVMAFFQEEEFRVDINEGSDGSVFLDGLRKMNSDEITNYSLMFLKQVFSAGDDIAIHFSYYGQGKLNIAVH